jgi:CO/xanthine dehydrogenase FAD-binding subunit
VEIEDGVYRRVRLVFGGVNMEPVRIRSIEPLLEGQPVINPAEDPQHLISVLQTSMVEFRPPADALVSSGYRRVSGMNLAYRVLEEATNVSRWRGMVSSERVEQQVSEQILNDTRRGI